MDRIPRPTWMMRVLVPSFVATALAVASTMVAAASSTLIQLSTDPYTNSTSQHKTEVEPDTLSNGSTIVSAFQVGRFFNGGASNIGFATSTNNGKKWTNGFLPGTTPFSKPPTTGPWVRASDPSVAFDAKDNVWLISFLGLHSSLTDVDVLVSRSTDGGLKWSNPVTVNANGHFNDKNWSVCDNTSTSPFFGNCYTEFDDNTLGDLEQMTTSSDGGLTWGPGMATQNNTHGIGGQPLVQPNGRVVVPYVTFSFVSFLIAAFVSDNGGASWNAGRVISPVTFRHPAGGIRAGIPLPSAEIDASGRVFVVWSDARFENGTASDMVMSTSDDGTTWSPVTRIPADPVGSGVDHFIPGLAVDRSTSGASAQLALAFYFYPVANCGTSTTPACQLEVGTVTSANGGGSWTSTSNTAGPMTLSWLPNTTQGRMVGDYISTSFAGGPAFPAFAVASAPTSGGSDCATATPNCNEAIFTVAGGVSVGGSALAATDQDNTRSTAVLTESSVTSR
jgi:BNR repeat protein